MKQHKKLNPDNEVTEMPLKDCDNSYGYCEWIKGSNDYYTPTEKIQIVKKLPAGLYDFVWNNRNNCYDFIKKTLNLDELLNLPNPVFEQILNDVKYFWNNQAKFEKYKFAYKRGILLYGIAGAGKTSLTALLSDTIINEMDGLVFSIKNHRDLEAYQVAIPSFLRRIEPNTPILTLMEDLDGLANNPETETMLLNVLDGFNQSNNIVNIGCTNYPERLKDRILNRPSRFDKRYYIGLPDATVRKFYFVNKIHSDDVKNIDIDEMVLKTEGLTISHLGELIKSVFIFGKGMDESIKELKDMKEYISSTKFETSKKLTGFGN